MNQQGLKVNSKINRSPMKRGPDWIQSTSLQLQFGPTTGEGLNKGNRKSWCDEGIITFSYYETTLAWVWKLVLADIQDRAQNQRYYLHVTSHVLWGDLEGKTFVKLCDLTVLLLLLCCTCLCQVAGVSSEAISTDTDEWIVTDPRHTRRSVMAKIHLAVVTWGKENKKNS